MKLKQKKTTKDRVAKAVGKSYNAIDTFRNVINQLQQANAELSVAKEEDYEAMEALQINIEHAKYQEEHNNKLIQRISAIIE